MDETTLQYLNSMGIQAWQLKQKTAFKTTAIDASDLGWEELRQCVANCTACGLEKTRTQTVFGVGNTQASLMIIGEAPGFNEDKQGEPFVGRAGQLLNSMLEAIQLTRKDIFIANILKCRPPNNRDPIPSEVELCAPYLIKQIELVNPKLLLAVGRISAQYLLDTKLTLSKLRGELYYYGTKRTPLLVTYHPAYLLRNPKDKAKAFADLQLTKKLLQEFP